MINWWNLAPVSLDGPDPRPRPCPRCENEDAPLCECAWCDTRICEACAEVVVGQLFCEGCANGAPAEEARALEVERLEEEKAA
jgi:hypothetical protein